MTEYKWDESKNQKNIKERSLSFDTAKHIWLGEVIQTQDIRKNYGEDRYIAIGEVDSVVLVVVYTWRGTNRRIISARKANDAERQRYHQAVSRRS
ncbi:hypothetical protein SAE02_75440 [Skermanella aerolata]|uniref:Toxin n=1 Tax=Skermanella aerolata TaxID=393310 RepID=A0A512E3U1_9PROT|nr:BrnT family toxin [Skermanella aerolata]GEO43396.1 hypothetical protein SAE02_75440 [Skermanella aerolata]